MLCVDTAQVNRTRGRWLSSRVRWQAAGAERLPHPTLASSQAASPTGTRRTPMAADLWPPFPHRQVLVLRQRQPVGELWGRSDGYVGYAGHTKAHGFDAVYYPFRRAPKNSTQGARQGPDRNSPTYAPATVCWSPSAKVYGRRSATTAHCSSSPSGLTCGK